MDDDETRRESSSETVRLGGTAGRGRLGAILARFSAREESTVIIGSTLLLGVVVLIAIVLSGPGPDDSAKVSPPPSSASRSPPSTNPDPPQSVVPQHGRVWVGYHDLMLAVPRSWAHSDTVSCGTTPTSAAPYPRSSHSKCSAEAPRERSTVTWLLQQVDASDLLDSGFFARTINGRHVLTTSMQNAGHAYIQYVALPTRDVLVVIRSPDRSMVERLVRTSRGMPADWVIVPDLRGQDPRRALAVLAETGLVGRADHNSGVVLPAETVVVNQNPAGGQVVERQTPVTIAVLPADRAD